MNSEISESTTESYSPARQVSQWLGRAIVGLLSYGQVPKHVAMIMDGNRRYARNHGIPIKEGHTKGFANAANMIYALNSMGVQTISFFMFGVDNFKRDPQEIEDIMAISRNIIGGWVAPNGLAHQLEIHLKLCGDRQLLELLEPELLGVLDHAMEVTKGYERGTVNLCIAYSGRRDIVRGVRSMIYDQTVPVTHSITQLNPDNEDHIGALATTKPNLETKEIIQNVIPGSIPRDSDDLAQRSFRNYLWTGCDPDPDIIIRTSGETRLSDFMPWQCCETTHLNFISCFWPEIGVQHLVLAVLNWRMGRSS